MSLRLVQISVCVLILFKAALQIQDDQDWWIYVPIYGAGAFLCILQHPENIVWRAASSTVILFGAALLAFLMWTMHHLADVITQEQFDEGRNMLQVAASLAMVTGIRLRSAQYHNIFAYLRTALLLAAFFIAASGMAYSLCFYTKSLPYCSYSSFLY